MAVDCLAYEDDGTLRTVWLLVLLFGGWPGALFYFFLRRRQRLQLAAAGSQPRPKPLPALPAVVVPTAKQPVATCQPTAGGLGTLAAILLAVVAIPGVLLVAACAGLVVLSQWHLQRQQEAVVQVAMQEAVPPALDSASPPWPALPQPGSPLAEDDPVAVGDQLLCQWAGEWQPVEVLASLPDGGLKIHWIGWSDGFDEIVPRSRLRRIEPAQVAEQP
jgi:hypothetical protein